jgi:hypothetical protein
MVEKETVFSSKVKYGGIFPFSDFYQFCYNWMVDEEGYEVAETKYTEKIKGDGKDVKYEWVATKKITDYIKFEIKINVEIIALKKVEVMQGNAKVKTNDGTIEIKVKGTMLRDYEGKFETNAFQKFLRSIYEKWIIVATINQFEEKLVTTCDEFLAQAKSYLDLEGKK